MNGVYKSFPEIKGIFLCKKCNDQKIASNDSFTTFLMKHLDKCGPQNIFFKEGELRMNYLTESQKIVKIMQVLEKDDILLDALAEVLLIDDGNPNVPYSTPLIPKSLRIQRLTDYLNLDHFSANEDSDKVKVIE